VLENLPSLFVKGRIDKSNQAKLWFLWVIISSLPFRGTKDCQHLRHNIYHIDLISDTKHNFAYRATILSVAFFTVMLNVQAPLKIMPKVW
jgi:hypothetical protein